ncbi:MAG TPA: hypothetical protein VI461_03915, partial [Chitinophagaceae bacterium]|nr:hypothetical protein [Chitinophagaceae bacterium]
NKPKSRPSEAEVKENTIKIWKKYVELENRLAVKRDSSYRKMSSRLIDQKTYIKEDSLIRDGIMNEMIKLKDSKAIDKILYLLFDTRVRYIKGAWSDFVDHLNRYEALRDTLPNDSITRNYLIQELNTDFTYKNNNFTERLGHTIEDIAIFLSKKYKYPFSIAELTWLNPAYRNIKRIARLDGINLTRPEIAPAGPGQNADN